MSEQNKTFKVSKKQPKEKKPFEKKFRLFVIIVSILLILVTIGMIILAKNKPEIVDEGPLDLGTAPEAGKIATTTLEPLKLTDKFYYNGLEIKNKSFTQNKIPGTENYKFAATFIEVSGLKNEAIQSKINEDLRASALDFYQKSQMEDESIVSVNVYQNVVGNFSDILSISMTRHVLYKDSKLDTIETWGINYKLKDGETFDLEDCFLETASVKKILSQSYYKSMVGNVAEKTLGEYQESMDLSEIDYSAIERKLREFMDNYNKNGVEQFYVSTSNIWIETTDGTIIIEMDDFYEDIAIYKRFLGKKLYQLNKDEKYYVFNRGHEEPYYSYFKLEKENLFIELKIDFFEEYIEGNKKERAQELINEAKTKMLLMLEKYKNTASETPEKGYILQMGYMPFIGETESDDYIYGDIYEYHMDAKYFKENIIDIIAARNREEELEYILCKNYAENNKNIKLKTTFDEIKLEKEENAVTENTVVENTVTENVVENNIVTENTVVNNTIENTVTNEVITNETRVENISE